MVSIDGDRFTATLLRYRHTRRTCCPPPRHADFRRRSRPRQARPVPRRPRLSGSGADALAGCALTRTDSARGEANSKKASPVYASTAETASSSENKAFSFSENRPLSYAPSPPLLAPLLPLEWRPTTTTLAPPPPLWPPPPLATLAAPLPLCPPPPPPTFALPPALWPKSEPAGLPMLAPSKAIRRTGSTLPAAPAPAPGPARRGTGASVRPPNPPVPPRRPAARRSP